MGTLTVCVSGRLLTSRTLADTQALLLPCPATAPSSKTWWLQILRLLIFISKNNDTVQFKMVEDDVLLYGYVMFSAAFAAAWLLVCVCLCYFRRRRRQRILAAREALWARFFDVPVPSDEAAENPNLVASVWGSHTELENNIAEEPPPEYWTLPPPYCETDLSGETAVVFEPIPTSFLPSSVLEHDLNSSGSDV